ncbi:unnamed protein product [Lactuca virosa]|uniref:Uncharacterized protein n=1 Tax=Lactuca virosa TaxID=75947 RepID=A0AAU9N501_9ASTR|nr:unnamed protein product [Lactuca virosa]
MPFLVRIRRFVGDWWFSMMPIMIRLDDCESLDFGLSESLILVILLTKFDLYCET